MTNRLALLCALSCSLVFLFVGTASSQPPTPSEPDEPIPGEWTDNASAPAHVNHGGANEKKNVDAKAVPPQPAETAAGGKTTADDEPGRGPALYGLGALAFGGIIIGLMTLLRFKQLLDTANFVKMSGLALVVCVGLSLIVVGYSQQQIAPMMGLLGTIAGYILGKTDERVASPAEKGN
jgi:hypothetical protein